MTILFNQSLITEYVNLTILSSKIKMNLKLSQERLSGGNVNYSLLNFTFEANSISKYAIKI